MSELLGLLCILAAFLVGTAFSACDCLDRIIILHNRGDFRLVSSPNYPSPYCPGIDCHWHIVAPDNRSRVQFSADNLDLRKNMDQLILYDFDRPQKIENRTESMRCSGDDLCYYTSRFQYLSIRFKTSSQEEIENFGFQAVVTIRNGTSTSSLRFPSFLLACSFLFLFIA